MKFANTSVGEGASAVFIRALKDEIVELMDICGLTAERRQEILDSEIESLIQERQDARKAKNLQGRTRSGISLPGRALYWKIRARESNGREHNDP